MAIDDDDDDDDDDDATPMFCATALANAFCGNQCDQHLVPAKQARNQKQNKQLTCLIRLQKNASNATET